MPFLRPAFWFAVAFLLAALECEIEGPHGWASAMPTCRLRHPWLERVLRPIFGGRSVTLYHLCMFSLVALVCHAGFFQGVPFSWSRECGVLTTLFLLCPTWDFLWFILNPAYGLVNFRREKIPWHAGRPWPFGLFPIDYAYGAALSLGFTVLGWIASDVMIVDALDGVVGLGFWAFLVAVTVDMFGPAYRTWRGRQGTGIDPP